MRHISADSQRIQARQEEEQGGNHHQLRRFRRPNLPFLFYAIIGRNWDAALRRVHTHPNEMFSVEDISGDTVLHYACRLDPPTDVVVALIPICFVKNREGATALHVAACYRCSAGVIRAMIEGESCTDDRTPLSLLLTNKARIPLHYACSSFRGLGLEAFRILLEATIDAQVWLEEKSKCNVEEQVDFVFENRQNIFQRENNEIDENRDRINAFTMQDSLGHTPLSLLFKRYRERVKYVIRYLERNRPDTSLEAVRIVQNELGGLWLKARLIVCRMLERNRDTVNPSDFDRQESTCPREAAVARQAAEWAAQRYQSYSYQNHEEYQDDTNERTFRLVHASVALAGYGCPIEMVKLAMSVYPQQVQEMDEDGNLPLHIAAVASSYIPDNFGSTSAEDSHMSGYSNLSGFNPRKPFGALIDMLLMSYPEAAKIPHGSSGRLPLILALEARQRSMADGLKSLIYAYPAALESKVFDPNLYPYILSMVGKYGGDGSKNKQLTARRKYKTPERTLRNHTLPTTLYDYLRAGPHLLFNFKE
mmetsp:Transcript_1652/g.3018  ORF Transcript_1652/g.3018 Transcript_1652/m.3018 type:complete len:535 (-) Transcript_1652:1118-2722(-)|eukprot:CAMPEP_0176504610 /NCGR_PEP_ID=MMETSP0200_2-20121128/16033_1 /TAXON_ID=947934 /ORGANISM="Chaetoceros sp., Strain GSL56" /LENGTH=534 /DNA_ID=CAMNT_0017904069 /DNA_START=119 /DNA_END=1723 /DNA_ORIENTATION=-